MKQYTELEQYISDCIMCAKGEDNNVVKFEVAETADFFVLSEIYDGHLQSCFVIPKERNRK